MDKQPTAAMLFLEIYLSAPRSLDYKDFQTFEVLETFCYKIYTWEHLLIELSHKINTFWCLVANEQLNRITVPRQSDLLKKMTAPTMENDLNYH